MSPLSLQFFISTLGLTKINYLKSDVMFHHTAVTEWPLADGASALSINKAVSCFKCITQLVIQKKIWTAFFTCIFVLFCFVCTTLSSCSSVNIYFTSRCFYFISIFAKDDVSLTIHCFLPATYNSKLSNNWLVILLLKYLNVYLNTYPFFGHGCPK